MGCNPLQVPTDISLILKFHRGRGMIMGVCKCLQTWGGDNENKIENTENSLLLANKSNISLDSEKCSYVFRPFPGNLLKSHC